MKFQKTHAQRMSLSSPKVRKTLSLSSLGLSEATYLPLPTKKPIKELEHFRQICEHFPTDWGHLIEVETGKILDTYNKEEYEE